MSQDEVTQIKVGGTPVGIIGLKALLEEVAREFENSPEEVIQEELIRRLRARNYIPEKAREDYAKAFLREFKKFLGQPFEEDAPEGLQIKVLGPGCAQCDRLEQELMQVMGEAGIMADVEHVRDAREIAKYGVFGTPALIINGEVKSVGKVPPKTRLKEWLVQAQK